MMPEHRDHIYQTLAGRLLFMPTSEEEPVWVKHKMELLARVTGLTDAVVHSILTLPEAERLLNDYIRNLKPPQEGEIRF